MLSQSPGQHNIFSPAPDDTLSSLLDTPSLPTTQSSSKKSSRWTCEEDELLRKYSSIYGERQWRKVSQKIPGKTSIQCLHRWTKILKPGLVKGAWTIEEDQKLYSWVNENGPNKWSQAAKLIQGRSGKQCRERWFNNLSPDVKKTEWTKEEDELISQLYQKYGSSWSQLAKFIPGRTENSIKNRFYSTLRRMATMKKKKSRGAGLNANSNGTVKEEDKDDEDSSEDKSSQFMMPENVQMPVGGFMFDAMGGLDELMVTPNMKINGKGRNISEKRMLNEDAVPAEENMRIKSIQSSGNKRLSLEESDRDFDAMWSIDGFEMMSPVNFGEYSSSKAVEKSLETDAGTDADTSHLCSKQNSKVAADEIYNAMPFFLSPVKSSQAQTNSNYMQGQGQIGYESNTNMMHKVPQQQQMGYVQPEKIDHMNAPRTYNNSSEPVNHNKQQQQHQTSSSDSSLLMIPQRIMEECSSQEVDGVQRVLNLIALLRVFSGQNVPALNMVCQNMASNVLKEFIGNMQKAISSTSTVHVNYIRHLLSIARSMQNNSEVDEVSKRMHYIYVQLSSLENLIENARDLVNKISAYLYVNNNNNNSNNININSNNNNIQPSVYGNYKENMNTNYVVEPMYKSDCYKPNAITIRIGTLNSGLEEISKKRAVN